MALGDQRFSISKGPYHVYKYITLSVKRQLFYGTKPVRYQGTEAAIARRFNRLDIERVIDLFCRLEYY